MHFLISMHTHSLAFPWDLYNINFSTIYFGTHFNVQHTHTTHNLYYRPWNSFDDFILLFFTLLVVVPWVEFNVNEHDLICSGNDNLFFLLWNIFKWFQIFRIVCFHIKFNILFLIPSISSTLSQSYFYLMHIFLRLFPTNYIILNCKWRFYFNDGGDDIWIYDLEPYRIIFIIKTIFII